MTKRETPKTPEWNRFGTGGIYADLCIYLRSKKLESLLDEDYVKTLNNVKNYLNSPENQEGGNTVVLGLARQLRKFQTDPNSVNVLRSRPDLVTSWLVHPSMVPKIHKIFKELSDMDPNVDKTRYTVGHDPRNVLAAAAELLSDDENWLDPSTSDLRDRLRYIVDAAVDPKAFKNYAWAVETAKENIRLDKKWRYFLMNHKDLIYQFYRLVDSCGRVYKSSSGFVLYNEDNTRRIVKWLENFEMFLNDDAYWGRLPLLINFDGKQQFKNQVRNNFREGLKERMSGDEN